MRVIHLSCVVPPEIGGIGSVAAREVTGLRARGIDARLVGPEAGTNVQNSRVERSFIQTVQPVWRFGNASILPNLRSLLQDADIVHLHYPFFGTAESVLLQSSKLPPIVVTFHMDAMASGWHGAVFAAHRTLVQPMLLKHASAILVSSYDYARRSSLSSCFSQHPERVKELPFGVDTDFFSPGTSRRTRFGIPEDTPTVMFAAGLDRAHAFKGLPVLLRALVSLDSNTHLIVVGDGDLRTSYESQAQDLGLYARVHFVGRLDAESLRDAYRSADILAVPSTNSAEAFGLVALEAGACGLPVVASDLPGVRTVVRYNETGFLVPPGNADTLASALSTLLIDEHVRRRMGSTARSIVEREFSWDRHLDGLEEVYRLCVSRS